MKTKYIWLYTAVNQIEDEYGFRHTEMEYAITNSDCAETVAHQIYEQLGEGYKITELSLKCSNPMEIE